MAEQVPDKFLDLFQKPALAHLATVMANGQDRYANHNPNLTRAIYKILPDRVIGSQA